jgi:tRNA G18 (ribose-2'-O)-methylase SpoU
VGRPMIVVDSPDDPRIQAFRLRERELRPRRVPERVRRGMRPEDQERVDPGLFVAEGDLVVERALAAGYRARSVLTDAARPSPLVSALSDDVEVYAASAEARRMLTGLGVALDVIALFERRPLPDPDDVLHRARRIVVAERVDNPTNVGAIVRSAVALGADAFVLDHESSDPLARRALRVSMGTSLMLPHTRVRSIVELIDVLHRLDVVTCALTPDASAENIDDAARRLDPNDRVAVLLGSEREGLADETMRTVRHRVRIPMADPVDSLNVAAAAAVACFALFHPSTGRSRE